MAQLNDLQKLVVQKVIESYDDLQKTGRVASLEEFCEKTGLDYSNFAKYRKLEKHIYPDQIVNLTNEFPIDKDWLLSKGTGAAMDQAIKGNTFSNSGGHNFTGWGTQTNTGFTPPPMDLNLVGALEKEIEGLKRSLEDKEKLLEEKEKTIHTLNRMITMLENQIPTKQ